MIRIFILLLSFYALAVADTYNVKMIKKIQSIKDENQTFSFAIYGDNRGRDDILLSIIKSVDHDKDILFSINNGDLVSYGFEYEFNHYLSLIKNAKKPIISIIGNHGIGLFENDSNYKKIFGKTNFAFSFQNSYFIILDDADDEGISFKQLSWLAKELNNSKRYTNRFIFMHIPLYDPRKGNYKEGHSLENTKQSRLLNDLFDKYHVTMIFCSHIHSFYKGFWHNTPYIISGGAGAPLVEGGFFHYIKVTVDGKKVKYKVVKVQ